MIQLEIDPSVFDERKKRSYYAEWEQRARDDAGLSEERIAKVIGEWIRESDELSKGRCPKCGALATRYVSHEHQHGNLPRSFGEGLFVMYRCSTQPPPGTLRGPEACTFMIDIFEVKR